MSTKSRIAVLLLTSLAGPLSPAAAENARPDIIIADFEGDDYAGWKPGSSSPPFTKKNLKWKDDPDFRPMPLAEK